jgi:hypothetical protein
MSRKGNPYDNALAESFVATLKTECFGDSIPPTKAAAKLMVFDFIETFYNTRPRHSALGYRSPAQFEDDWLCSLREGCSGGGSLGGETCLTEQVGSRLAALAVNNSPELFKPPETTRSNHQRAFNAAAKPLTSTKKQKPSPHFRRKITPQGGVISPLLANIYLNLLDWEINEGNRSYSRMVRYADDFVVLCPAGRGQQTQEQIKRWLTGKGLALNECKTRRVNIYREGIRSLGFRLNGRRSGRGRAYLHVEPEAGSCAALRGRLCEILNHYTEWRTIAGVVSETNAVLRGWCGYFHYGNSTRVFGKMQYWVCNRLRRWV